MSKTIEPSWLPRVTTPVAKDQADVLRGIRGDYNGGLFGGYAGSMYAVYRFIITTQFPAGGNVYVVSDTVPTNYLYVIQQISARHTDTAARGAYLEVVSGGVAYTLVRSGSQAYNDSLIAPNEIVLQAGDYLRYQVVALNVDKYVALSICGYSVRLQ